VHQASLSDVLEGNVREAVPVSDILCDTGRRRDDECVEPPVSHADVTTIMGLIVGIRDEVVMIRQLLEDDDGEEEAAEADA
jgi:hypothetical protein